MQKKLDRMKVEGISRKGNAVLLTGILIVK